MAAQSQSNLQALTSEHANLQLVISQLKRALAESDQCETLEAEGSQLRVELDDALSLVEDHQSVIMEHDSVVGTRDGASA